ncbi:MAG: hypothetical protein ACI9CO_002193, partial [Candidatus Azotimanducaceae bacterium]
MLNGIKAHDLSEQISITNITQKSNSLQIEWDD